MVVVVVQVIGTQDVVKVVGLLGVGHNGILDVFIHNALQKQVSHLDWTVLPQTPGMAHCLAVDRRIPTGFDEENFTYLVKKTHSISKLQLISKEKYLLQVDAYCTGISGKEDNSCPCGALECCEYGTLLWR
jgi:hypothetical protein